MIRVAPAARRRTQGVYYCPMKSSVCSRVLGLALLLVMLSGCGRGSGPLPDPPRVATCTPGHPGGRLVLAIPGTPRTFNPLLAYDAPSDAVVRLLFSSLVHFDMTSRQPQPGLAQSWSVAPDQKTWTFKLRKNLRWSDGEPLTAADVTFTWNKVMYNPAYNQGTYQLFRIKGKNFVVTNLDAQTVRVITPEVFAPFLNFFGSIIILPKHMLAQAAKDNRFVSAYDLRTRPERIVGSGPFRLKQVVPGKSVLLEANPDYYAVDKAGRRLPYFDEVMLRVAANPAAMLDLFLNGKSDVCEKIRPEDWPRFEQAAGSGRFRILDLGLGAERDFLWFNQNTGVDTNGRPFVDPVKLKWFRDRKFRQAVSCAIDRESMVKEIYGGRGLAVYGFMSSENPRWNNPDIPRFSYDPAKARALFAAAGLEDRNGDGVMEDVEGHPVEVTLYSNIENPARNKMAEMIRDDLKRVGFRIEYQPMPFPNLLDKVNRTFDYEAALMGFGGGTDPAAQVNLLKSDQPLHQWFPSQKTPSTGWEAQINSLMDAQMRTLDAAQRKKDFDRVQAIWAEEQPMISTVVPFTRAAIRSNIANARPSAFAPYPVTWNIEELYLKKSVQ